jgi:hypothetical protein
VNIGLGLGQPGDARKAHKNLVIRGDYMDTIGKVSEAWVGEMVVLWRVAGSVVPEPERVVRLESSVLSAPTRIRTPLYSLRGPRSGG